MSDDLVERVAREFCTVDGADPCAVVCSLCLHRARLVVAVVLEEAARVAENYDGPGMESVPDAPWGDAQATKDDIAYYIRALVKEPQP